MSETVRAIAQKLGDFFLIQNGACVYHCLLLDCAMVGHLVNYCISSEHELIITMAGYPYHAHICSHY